MKKTLKLLIILAVALVLLSGCAKIDYNVDVKSDGKAEVSYVVAVQNEFLSDDTSDSDSENMYLESLKSEAKRAEKNGYTVKDFKDDKYTGYTITKNFDKVEEISLEDAFGDNIIKDDKGSRIKFEKDGSNIKISQDAKFDMTQYSQGYEVIYTINLPVKVKENNATKVDGNKLTWVLSEDKGTSDLTSQKATNAEDLIKTVSFKAEGGASVLSEINSTLAGISTIFLVLIIVGVVVILGVIIVVIICVSKSKKKSKSVVTATTKVVEPVKEDKKTEENK